MRNCGRCGHHNVDRLTYCSACGRRLPETDRVPLMRDARAPTSAGDGAGYDTTHRDPGPAFAATVAHAHVHRARAESGRSPVDTGIFTKGTDATRYVFGYVRGRMVAEGRRRRLIEERDGARRLIEGALVELGQIVLTDGTGTPELAGLVDEIVRARARREGATTDLAAAEKFRTVEDLRLGM